MRNPRTKQCRCRFFSGEFKKRWEMISNHIQLCRTKNYNKIGSSFSEKQNKSQVWRFHRLFQGHPLSVQRKGRSTYKVKRSQMPMMRLNMGCSKSERGQEALPKPAQMRNGSCFKRQRTHKMRRFNKSLRNRGAETIQNWRVTIGSTTL